MGEKVMQRYFGVHVDVDNPDWEKARRELESDLRQLGVSAEKAKYRRILAYNPDTGLRVRRLDAEVTLA